MTTKHEADFILNPGWQTEFLRSGAYALCVTGERGSGKTTALLIDAAKTIGKGYGPAHNAIVLVPSREMIRPILVETSAKLYPKIGGTFDGSQRWTFPEGERIWFGAANAPRVWQDACFSYVGIDEIQDVAREDFEVFATRLRATGKEPPPRFRATRTPQPDWIAVTFDTMLAGMKGGT